MNSFLSKAGRYIADLATEVIGELILNLFVW